MSKQRVGMILLGLVGVVLLASGEAKVFGVQMMVNQPGDKNLCIGLIEWASVIAMFIPAPRNLSFFLMSSYLGGVIASELIHYGATPDSRFYSQHVAKLRHYPVRTLGDG